jgi:sialic acid synthase SpsE
MAKLILRDGTELSDYGNPYFVAEVNSSHNGDVGIAKAMIEAAAEAGCNCVKFQSWTAGSLYSEEYFKANPISKRIFVKFSLSETELKDLANYCRSNGVQYSSTPYSKREVDFLLNECGAPFVKIASMESNNYPFLRYIAKKGAPIVLSTGMSTIDEIKQAVEVIEDAGNSQICLLHCISIYPPELNTIHLNNIIGLREQFNDYPIGFSDHSIGSEIANAATALGAALIEKHLTLDHKKIGMDNQMAMEPEDLKNLVHLCRNVHEALGCKERILMDAEIEQKKKMRRSIVAARDLKSGQIINAEDLDAKRPGTGISPDRIDSMIGKTATRDIAADQLLEETDIK